MKALVKKLARFVAGDYSIYHVHRGTGAAAVAGPPDGLSFAAVDEARVRNDPSPLDAWLGVASHA